MSRPVRLQLSRKRGFDLQAHSRAVNGVTSFNVSRPSKWGNPFTITGCRDAGFKGSTRNITAHCVAAFDAWLTSPYWRTNWDGAESEQARDYILKNTASLRGFNLACWCRLCSRHAAIGKPFDEACPDCAPCHADVLGARANGFICEEVD